MAFITSLVERLVFEPDVDSAEKAAVVIAALVRCVQEADRAASDDESYRDSRRVLSALSWM